MPTKRSSFFSHPHGRLRRSSKDESASLTTQTLFGMLLSEATKVSGIKTVLDDPPDTLYLTVPSVVSRCIDFLVENQCLAQEGVFRVGGNLRRIKALQNALNSDPLLNILEENPEYSPLSVYDVLTLLKRYLNALPDLIIPAELAKDIRSELDNVAYKDLIMFTQTAHEAVSLKIEKKEGDGDQNTLDTAIKSPSLDDLLEGHNKSVLVVDVDPESNSGPSSPPLKSTRPMPPNVRKQLLMLVILTDLGLFGRRQESVFKGIERLIEYMASLVADDLENCNADVLIYILRFLSLLARNYEKTRMNLFNLLKIFQTSFFLNVQLSGGSDLLQGSVLNRVASGANNNRQSVISSFGGTGVVQPTFTRNSIVSTTSGTSGLYTADNGTSTSINGNSLTVPGRIHDNFSLESFNLINGDYNVHQLVLKAMIDNYELFIEKLRTKDGAQRVFGQEHLDEVRSLGAPKSATLSPLERKKLLSSPISEKSYFSAVSLHPISSKDSQHVENGNKTSEETRKTPSKKTKKLLAILHFLHKNKKGKAVEEAKEEAKVEEEAKEEVKEASSPVTPKIVIDTDVDETFQFEKPISFDELFAKKSVNLAQSSVKQSPTKQSPTKQSPVKELQPPMKLEAGNSFNSLNDEDSKISTDLESENETKLDSQDSKSRVALDKKPESTSRDQVEKAIQEEPIQEEPIQDKPIQEEPIQEEPIQEEPIQEKPIQEEPIQEEPIQEEPIQEEPIQEEPIQEEPIQEEPIQEKPIQEKPVQEELVQEKPTPEAGSVQQVNPIEEEKRETSALEDRTTEELKDASEPTLSTKEKSQPENNSKLTSPNNIALEPASEAEPEEKPLMNGDFQEKPEKSSGSKALRKVEDKGFSELESISKSSKDKLPTESEDQSKPDLNLKLDTLGPSPVISPGIDTQESDNYKKNPNNPETFAEPEQSHLQPFDLKSNTGKVSRESLPAPPLSPIKESVSYTNLQKEADASTALSPTEPPSQNTSKESHNALDSSATSPSLAHPIKPVQKYNTEPLESDLTEKKVRKRSSFMGNLFSKSERKESARKPKRSLSMFFKSR